MATAAAKLSRIFHSTSLAFDLEGSRIEGIWQKIARKRDLKQILTWKKLYSEGHFSIILVF